MAERQFDPGRVGVLLGGESSEREISMKSGQAVLTALASLGVEAVPIGLGGDIAAELTRERLDCAFIALHGRFGEDGGVQSLLEERGIPYTGSGVEASRLAMDKLRSRETFRRVGLAVPETLVVKTPQEIPGIPFSFPVVVKPSREGSSIGLSLAADPGDLPEAVETALAFDDTVLIEPFLKGIEITAGVLDNRALPLVEIMPTRDYFDFEAKYTKGVTEFVVPARLEPGLAARAQAAGLSAHRAFGCRAYSRTDMIVSPSGQVYVLEVNTIPGLTATSLFPMACAAEGIDFPGLCLELLRLAHASYEGKR